jgi:tryptophan synthase beta chain
MQMTDLRYDLPDERGHFGPYGGVFVAETLMRALDELREQYAQARVDPAFIAEFDDELAHYVGRPSRSSRAAVVLKPAARRSG